MITIRLGSNVSTSNSDLISKTISESPIKEITKEPEADVLVTPKVENGEIQVTKGLLKDKSEKEVNKDVADIETSTEKKTDSCEKEESPKEKTDSVDQTAEKISELTETNLDIGDEIYITVVAPEHKTIEAYEPSMNSGWVKVSPDNPISIETTLSVNSKVANADGIQEYDEETYPVFQYTYDCVDGCWKFTKSAKNNFYFYKMNDECFSSSDTNTPKMIRNYLSDDRFDKEIQYKGFSMIKEDIIAVLTEKNQGYKVNSQVYIINISTKKILAVINLNEPQGKIAKRMLFKSDNVIAFILNIAKGEILPGHTHLESTLFLQVMEDNAKVFTDGNETSLQVGELMQVDGQESLQVVNTGDDVLRLYVTISPMGSEAFATDANV